MNNSLAVSSQEALLQSFASSLKVSPTSFACLKKNGFTVNVTNVDNRAVTDNKKNGDVTFTDIRAGKIVLSHEYGITISCTVQEGDATHLQMHKTSGAYKQSVELSYDIDWNILTDTAPDHVIEIAFGLVDYIRDDARNNQNVSRSRDMAIIICRALTDPSLLKGGKVDFKKLANYRKQIGVNSIMIEGGNKAAEKRLALRTVN